MKDAQNANDSSNQNSGYRILAIDDQEEILAILKGMLQTDNYNIITAASGEEALELFQEQTPDLILTDLEMPGMGGVKLLEEIRRHPEGKLLQLIVVTGSEDTSRTMAALDAGADEIIRKPFKLDELQIRVRNALAHKSLIDQLDSAENVVFSLAKMVEARDCETGDHCDRLGNYCRSFSDALKLDQPARETLFTGSYLHDIGKIAIPDAILLAARPLEDNEWKVMRSHPAKGESLCAGLHAARAALPIIRSHHEKWNGSGYPDGLKGEEIPRAARIFQIVDIFDALTSARPYKKALSIEEAMAIMERENSKGLYEPGLLDAWKELILDSGAA